MPLNEDIKKDYIGSIVDLWQVQAAPYGGTNRGYSAHINEITFWKGTPYMPFPIEASVSDKALDRAPSRITLTIGNVNKYIFLMAKDGGDLIGARVTRWRTLSKYIVGAEFDDTQHWPPEYYTIIQLKAFSRDTIQFELANNLNLPRVKLPARQVLKDDVPGNLYAPGVGLPGMSRR